ncbi:hypothetical protein [uncultured Methylobacterium sp.]
MHRIEAEPAILEAKGLPARARTAGGPIHPGRCEGGPPCDLAKTHPIR